MLSTEATGWRLTIPSPLSLSPKQDRVYRSNGNACLVYLVSQDCFLFLLKEKRTYKSWDSANLVWPKLRMAMKTTSWFVFFLYTILFIFKLSLGLSVCLAVIARVQTTLGEWVRTHARIFLLAFVLSGFMLERGPGTPSFSTHKIWPCYPYFVCKCHDHIVLYIKKVILYHTHAFSLGLDWFYLFPCPCLFFCLPYRVIGIAL